MEYKAGDVNLYFYVGNNPVNANDPYGLMAQNLDCYCWLWPAPSDHINFTTTVWKTGTAVEACNEACSKKGYGGCVEWAYHNRIQQNWRPNPSILCSGVENHSGCKCCTEEQCISDVNKLVSFAQQLSVPNFWQECQIWAETFVRDQPLLNDKGINTSHCVLTPRLHEFVTNMPVWGIGVLVGRYEHHYAVEITLCNGNSFWVDSGWIKGGLLGKGDHFFAPEEIPPGYRLLW